MSRRIYPLDIERFHIMIGARKSSRLRLKFRFHINEKQVVESEEFRVNIWNPRNSRKNERYSDVSLVNRLIKQKELEINTEGKTNLENAKELCQLRTLASNYPLTGYAPLTRYADRFEEKQPYIQCLEKTVNSNQ